MSQPVKSLPIIANASLVLLISLTGLSIASAKEVRIAGFKEATVSSRNSKPILEISIAEGGETHRFELAESKKQTELVFQKGRQKPIRQVLPEREAAFFMREATRLLWASKHREPASAAKCTVYATLLVQGESVSICKEHTETTGKAFGFLNTLQNRLR